MVRTSKNKLSEKVLLRIYQLFFEIFARSNSNDKFLNLLDDILGPDEKTMIAKRVGIIYLLIKGCDIRTIASTLKVSTSTAVTYSRVFYHKDSHLVNVIKNMIKKEKVLGFIEDVFADLFIQPGIKIGHHEMKWEHKKRKEERKTLG